MWNFDKSAIMSSLGRQPSYQPLYLGYLNATLTPQKLGESLPDQVNADEEHEEKQDEDGSLMILHDLQHRIHP